MEYKSINELDRFQFHDAQIESMVFADTEMTWEVSSINATTQNTQNSHPKDMCIENARMKFEDVSLKSLVFCAYTVHDSHNNLVESVEEKQVEPEEYQSILADSVREYCRINGMNEFRQESDNKYISCFDIDSAAGFFYLTLSFSKSIIEWSEFSGEAWYEDPKWKE